MRDISNKEKWECCKENHRSYTTFYKLRTCFTRADKEKSGDSVSEKVEKGILWDDELGKTLKNMFIQECLKYRHDKHFFDPVSWQKLKTMKITTMQANSVSGTERAGG